MTHELKVHVPVLVLPVFALAIEIGNWTIWNRTVKTVMKKGPIEGPWIFEIKSELKFSPRRARIVHFGGAVVHVETKGKE